MPSYRIYKLNPAGRIVSGEWIEAATDEQAQVLAHEHCDHATPSVELWDGPRRVAVLPCEDPVAA